MPSDVSRRRFLHLSGAAGLAGVGTVVSTGPSAAAQPVADDDVLDEPVTRGIHDTEAATDWKDAFLSANGEQGILVHGNPRAETIIYNHHKYVLPNGSAGTAPPDIAGRLEEVRDLCLAGQFGQAEGVFNEGWNLLWTQEFHPGHRTTLAMPGQGPVSDYRRITNFRTGEIQVRWADDAGTWLRRSFVSRADNVVVHHILPPAGTGLNLTVACDGDVGGRPDDVEYATVAALGDNPGEAYLDIRGTYPVFPRSGRAFQAVTRVISDGGSVAVQGDTVEVTGAGSVLLLTAGDRFFDPAQVDGGALRAFLAGIADSYARLRDRHVAIHRPIYDRLSLDLGGDPEDRALPTGDLIDKQLADRDTLNLALVEKVFDAGRYFLLSSSGYFPPRLTALWLGQWGAAWSGDFTTDANVNLQVAGMNIGAMPEAALAYANLILTQTDDWKVNGRNIYGVDGLHAPTRTDGENGFMFHFSPWAGQMWTAGANWLLYPLYEHYLVTGDENFLRQRLMPALKQAASFYEGFLTRTDDDGNLIFVPSMSPENSPSNTGRMTSINATMDVSAGRNALQTAIEVCEKFGEETGPGEAVERWKALLDKIPPYRINEDGALAEWGWPTLEDRYNHRHASHVYPAWPMHEISPEETPELWVALRRALELRGDGNSSAHGFLQRGFGGVRAKDGEYAYETLRNILTRNFLFRSYMTSHNPNLSTYNADAANAMPAILMEMLVYSKPGVVELLPAVPRQLATGTVEGIKGRGRVTVERLDWDLPKQRVLVTLRSDLSQEITLISRRGIKRISGDARWDDSELGSYARVVSLPAGRPVVLRIELPTPEHLIQALLVGGKPLPEFDGEVTEYTYQVFAGAAAPEVTAIPATHRVHVSIEPTTTLPGTTLVHARVPHEGRERTYAVRFVPVNFLHLSDTEWLSATVGWGTIQRDRSIEGNTITLRGPDGPVVYEKGLGTHAVSEIVYSIPEMPNGRFQCYVGVDQESGGNGGSVTFQVYVDDEEVFSSGVMTYTTPQQVVDVSVAGAQSLRLVVGDAGNGIGHDHGDWADAKLVAG